FVEAMRVPRIRRVDVMVDRLGVGLDGSRVVLLTDTHYGPIDRARWSSRVIDKVNELDADIVCHTGDIADGSVAQRREPAGPTPPAARRTGPAGRPGGSTGSTNWTPTSSATPATSPTDPWRSGASRPR